MTLEGIILERDYETHCVDKRIYSLSSLRSIAYQYTSIVLCLLWNDTYTYVDFKKLISEHPPYDSATTWDDYVTTIESVVSHTPVYNTHVAVPTYMTIPGPTINNRSTRQRIPTPFSSLLKKQLNIISVENDFGIAVECATYKNKAIRSRQIYTSKLPDLVFTKTDRSKNINFNNTLPVVNGCICYPEVWGNNLFAYEGRRFINRHTRYNKNLLLLDFSPFGQLHIIKLSQCIDTSIQRQDNITCPNLPYKRYIFNPTLNRVVETKRQQTVKATGTNYTIRFKTPVCNAIGVPMLIIGGRMFLPDKNLSIQRTTDSRYAVTFKLPCRLYEYILLSNLQNHSKFIKNTRITKDLINKSINKLFNDCDLNSSDDDSTGYLTLQQYMDTSVPFLAIIDTRSVFTAIDIPSFMTIRDKLLFKKDAGGLLINKATHEIVDYVRHNYTSNTLAHISEPYPMRIIKRDSPHILNEPIIGLEMHNRVEVDKYNPFNNYDDTRNINNYRLIDFIA